MADPPALCFSGGFSVLGLEIIGLYLWLVLQNARSRPDFVVQSVRNVERVETLNQSM